MGIITSSSRHTQYRSYCILQQQSFLNKEQILNVSGVSRTRISVVSAENAPIISLSIRTDLETSSQGSARAAPFYLCPNVEPPEQCVMHAGMHVPNTLQTLNLRRASRLFSALSGLAGSTKFVSDCKTRHGMIIQPFEISRYIQHSFKRAQLSRSHGTCPGDHRIVFKS